MSRVARPRGATGARLMQLGLAGTVVLVTGGTAGIGAAIARALVAEGARPAILARDPPPLALVADLPGHLFRTVELADDRATADAVASVLREAGRIDAVVNNAGGNDHVGLDAGPDAFRRSLEQNLVQAYTVVHHALSALRRANGAAIVNIASKTAVTGQGGTSGYTAAKGGILALTREWAVSLLADGIRVNAVVPAEVATEGYESWLAGRPEPAAERAAITARVPLGRRMTTPAEIADAVLFLLSARSAHTTGQHVFVDGGYTHLDRAAT